MKIHDIIRLLKKHWLILIIVPAILGVLVAYTTTDVYTSRTTLYTGMTSGTNVQIDQSFNLYTTNASFDNLINIIQSRETSQEVALKLFTLHLMIEKPDPKYISNKSYLELRTMVPAKIKGLIYKKLKFQKNIRLVTEKKEPADSIFNFLSTDKSFKLPPYIDADDYKQTLKNLESFLKRDDTNFVFKLINHGNRHYSVKAVSNVTVKRLSSSDLIELTYNSDDPAVAQQTLQLLTEVCMKNYKSIKESRTDVVVRYYEEKIKEASLRLSRAEDELLTFNEENKIVDFEDQGRSAASARGSLQTELENRRIKLAGSAAGIKQVEEKLLSQKKVQERSGVLIQKRNELAEINARLATAELSGSTDTNTIKALRSRGDQLKDQIGDAVGELYSSGATIEGVPAAALLETYNQNVRDYEENKTAISMLQGKIRGSESRFNNFAPAGIQLKRIQREMTIAETEYMNLLQGLNTARLKEQDINLSSNIRAVDPPYYPLSPETQKKMMLIILAAVFGLLVVLSLIFTLEYFDLTLRDPEKAARILKLEPAGVFPKLHETKGMEVLPFITNRLLEMIIQQLELHPKGHRHFDQPKTILFFSMLDKEGKTTLVGNIAQKMKDQGKKVVVINFSSDAMFESKLASDKPNGKGKAIALPVFKEKANVELMEYALGDSGVSRLGIPETKRNVEEHFIYQIDESYYSINNYHELLDRDQFNASFSPDYILIELPPVLYHPYPAGLVASSDISIIVCRANRAWTQADKGALNTFMKIAHHDPLFLLNGVEKDVVKAAIGDISKKRRKMRKHMRKAAS